MPTDPFVAPTLEDHPRQEPNLAPGVRLPAARAWVADRAGDLPTGQPEGALFGRPGPNIGYAVALAHRLGDRLDLGAHESSDDVLAIVAELAMKRAASFGRAPVITDVEVAATLLGYQGEVDPAFVAWRVEAVHGVSHEYGARRALVDGIPDAVLRMPPKTAALLGEVRGDLVTSIASD
ncbi:MAG TPA: hypothetical protein VFZ17_00100 [Acidimicrobiia bacterium]|nr:hypothetical protein [Acidimicrobiia bacterium]